MKKLLKILLFLPQVISAQQLYIPDNALVHISEGATLEVGGDLENNGILQNAGTLSLYGDWTINNNFNGLTGSLRFLGGSNQLVSPPQLTVRELVINQGGEVSFPGSQYTVLERLELKFGNIKLGENTRFVLEPNVKVDVGSPDSYFDGKLISKGSGIKIFPLGANGVHAPVTLLNVFGVDAEIAAEFQSSNAVDPVPGDSLLGVSHRGLWEIELLNGTTDPSQVEIEFNAEDLKDFRLTNNIRHRVNSPVLAYANDPGGIYKSLGVESLLNSDSLTYGTIVSEETIQPLTGEKIYLAMALAPRIPDEGLYYIPEAFSPQASDPNNQTFKIFGEHISEDGFDLQIYNRYGVVVYSTNSFEEANQNGWDGENQQTGAEEPAGVYYYTVKFQFETGLPIQEKGAFYLVK
ncbi:gliding motility-associated C-terminal domain-containing protein [Ekhidna lutea]|uniref:Gliding motility-associated C-terminal domain-containing protein n=1 Tax=Ekhidna lutea TaxID=447679 RepID=A0A239EB19_EKHLU|nr:gliding motility-associated C-terminal domain-containing protein [Ekhidna lutea]SNS41112.1 gliding motility-associated C-terminal domain-containing protein [Ekhidna lutea]